MIKGNVQYVDFELQMVGQYFKKFTMRDNKMIFDDDEVD